MEKINLWGLTLGDLEELASQLGFPKFTAKQIALWIYGKKVTSIEDMTNLSKEQRRILEEKTFIGLTPPVKVDISIDGTKKYLFPSKSGYIEAAYLPEEDRATLCLSSQVGCKMGCLFCMTGKQGFQNQLTAGEILNQIRSIPEMEKLTHFVYMGMGEPLDNLDNVLKSLEILTADWGFGYGTQKITLSTVGLLPGMETFFKKTKVRFALSLHTPFEDQRRELMPVQNVYPLQAVLKFLKDLSEEDDRRISIEYICFEGLNDTPRHVKELVRILHGLKTRINLISYHSIPGTPLKGSSLKAMEEFRNALNDKGLVATIRRSRGQDIYAACGLLSTKALIKKAQEDY